MTKNQLADLQKADTLAWAEVTALTEEAEKTESQLADLHDKLKAAVRWAYQCRAELTDAKRDQQPARHPDAVPLP